MNEWETKLKNKCEKQGYTSYILICPSSEAVISSCESGENVSDLIGIACPEIIQK